ncbi:MAG TPA: UDP-3-O-(3-hydroxymyristoyl)glucosamine N-acyltransferase [Terracidiphilus sp.]|nr:UDP-3-O-(3-hydroxymyristoyl)glucosamine N-acyltransferase [Terracidiphilus sp.]
MKLSDLIERLGGTLAHGSPDHRLRGVNSAAQAGVGDIVFAEDAKSAREALDSKAGVVVLRAGIAGKFPSGKCVVETPQPRLWFARAGKLLKTALPVTGVHPSAVIGAGVKLGEGVTVGACAVIEEKAQIGARTRIDAGAVIGRGVRVGEYCCIYPRAVLYPGTSLGNWVVIHAGAVLGADGFGYVRNPATGAYTQFPQQGTLVIEDEVEIGANTTIDRGALAETRIRRGVKIDNLVHVGHNCDIGEDVILVALTGISGSSSVGKGALLAGQVGIGDHAHVGPGVILGGQSGVFNGKTVTAEGLRPGTVLYGTPARPLKQVLREQAVLARLAKRQSHGGSEPGE